eukprot:742342_1
MFMRIRTIFMWLVIYTSFDYNASNEVTEFRFKRYDDSTSYSSHSILITLWFGTTIYQVSAVAPGDAKTWLTFSMQNEPYLSVIGRNCSNITQAKIMFELDNPDSVCVDQVEIHTQSGDWYGIDRMYSWYENKFLDWLCIDNENAQYAPFKQIIYFDTMRPNMFIDNAGWRNGMNVIPQSNTYQCDPFPTTRLTPTHGTPGGNPYSALNLGRVYAMLDWGLCSNQYLQLRGWESDLQITSTDYGVGITRSLCTSFSLSSDDSITGYQIWFDSNGISGLSFWTHNGLTLSCIGINDSTTTSYAKSYDYGPFNFSYLTGWHVMSGSWIDQIQFQFTESSLTASPTQATSAPSMPSMPPSDVPTLPTYNPSQVPSINPTNRPTFSTNDPSTIPSQAHSVNPTYVNSMYNITPSDAMETEQNEASIRTTEIVSSQLNPNIFPTNLIMGLILSALALCCVCTVIAICAYMKKYNIMMPIANKVTSVDDDDDGDIKRSVEIQPGSGSSFIQEAQNQNQMDVAGTFEHIHDHPGPLHVPVEGNEVPGDPRVVYNMDNADDTVVIGDDDVTETKDHTTTRDHTRNINIHDDEFVIEEDEDVDETAFQANVNKKTHF